VSGQRVSVFPVGVVRGDPVRLNSRQ
jgi:hypothetical protein